MQHVGPILIGGAAATLKPLLLFLALGGEAAASIVNDPWSPLINLGAIGCVLLWFMLRTDPRLRRIEEAIDRQSRATLVSVLSRQGISEAIKEEARAILSEIEVADDHRKHK